MSKTAPIKPFNGKPTSSLQGTDISPAQAYKMTNYNKRLDEVLSAVYLAGTENGLSRMMIKTKPTPSTSVFLCL